MERFDLNLLGALDALLTERNVTRAAEKLNVTQPTMSGMLQRLRYRFRDQLLVRNGRGMDLTPLALVLRNSVRDALRGIEALLLAEPIFDHATSRRSFTIMASDYCMIAFMPRVFAQISRDAPGVRINTRPIVKPLESLVTAEVDLCIGPHELTQLDIDYENLQCEYLFTDDFVSVVRNDHQLGETSSLEEYLSFPHVGIEFQGIPASFETIALSQHVPHFRASYVVTEFSQIPCVVAQSNIVGVVQRRLATIVARALPIRLFKPPFIIPDLEEAMIWHPRYVNDPAHIWLRNLILLTARSWSDGEEMVGPYAGAIAA